MEKTKRNSKIILSTQLRISRGLVARVDACLKKINAKRERDGFPSISRNSFVCDAVENYVETHKHPA